MVSAVELNRIGHSEEQISPVIVSGKNWLESAITFNKLARNGVEGDPLTIAAAELVANTTLVIKPSSNFGEEMERLEARVSNNQA